jgi:cytochrome bd-type quinol oxidase subunit 2
MKKYLRVLLPLLSVIVFVSAPVVHAQNIGTELARDAAIGAGYSEDTSNTSFASTVGSVVKIIISSVGVVFISLTVYAGLLWMTARGEDSQIEKAQKIIRAAIIGLILTVSAYSITSFVVPRILVRTISQK